MSFIEKLTPKDTEEIKPNLFIQRRGNYYRQIYPAAWNGKINWYNFITGGHWTKLFWFFIILFIVFGFYVQSGDYKKFHDLVMENPYNFCESIRIETPNRLNILEVLNESAIVIPDNP